MDDPPLVAMTSPWVPIIATLLIAAIVGACATAPLVAAFGRFRPLTLRICDPAVAVAVVVVVMSVVIGVVIADGACPFGRAPRISPSRICAPVVIGVVVAISVVIGALTAGVAESSAPGLN